MASSSASATPGSCHALYLQALRQSGYDGRVTLTGTLPAYADDGETAIALKKAIA